MNVLTVLCSGSEEQIIEQIITQGYAPTVLRGEQCAISLRGPLSWPWGTQPTEVQSIY